MFITIFINAYTCSIPLGIKILEMHPVKKWNSDVPTLKTISLFKQVNIYNTTINKTVSDISHIYHSFLVVSYKKSVYHLIVIESKVLITRKVSWQWAQMTLHMPGKVGTGGVTGDGAKLMILLQSGRGQAMRWEDDLQIRRQLQGQRTYFFPGGAFLIGWNREIFIAQLQVTLAIRNILSEE